MVFYILEKCPMLKVSINTIKRARKHLATRPKYCQIVRETNRLKRLAWCEERIEEGDCFDDVIFTDECSIQMDHHGQLYLGPNIQSKFIFGVESVKLELQILLFLKVLSTCICIIILVSYIGTLISTRYTAILDAALKPFLEKSFPDNQYRFQQDNDPKHVSNHTREYFQNCGINWWSPRVQI